MRDEQQYAATASDSVTEDVFVARQPIFTANLDICAYELLFRSCNSEGCALIRDFDAATITIIADGYALACRDLPGDVRVCVNVAPEVVLSRTVLALPPERCLLEVPGGMEAGPVMLQSLKDLRAAGYHFALDNVRPEHLEGAAGLMPLMDTLKIAVNDLPGLEVARLKKRLAGWKGLFTATRVEDWDEFEGSRCLGFERFQGFFFSRPKELVGKKLPSHKISRMNLLRVLADDAADMSKVVEVISTDLALSVRLLHFVNSAAFGLDRQVDSMARAASLVGLNTLKKWALAAVLSDADPSAKGRELSYHTLHGAFFLRLLAEKGVLPAGDKDTLFLLGLLRSLDALMGLPMDVLLAELPLKPQFTAALLRDPGEPLARYVELLRRVDMGDWDGARAIFGPLGVPVNTAALAFMEAGRVTTDILNSAKGA